MNKAINILVPTVLLGVSALLYINMDINKNAAMAQMSELEQRFKTNTIKLDMTSDNYNVLSGALDDHENTLRRYQETLSTTLTIHDQSLTTLDKALMNDIILSEEVVRLSDQLTEQDQKISEVKELATAVVIPEPIAVLPETVVKNIPIAVLPEPIAVLPEPVVKRAPIKHPCPQPDSSVNFGKYISKLNFNKSTAFVVSFDVQDGAVKNVSYSTNVYSKLNRAVTKYLDKAISTENNVTNCSIPFKIEV
jgi:hypothetical protein|tara:strand:- start:360 stop:1109 length:750 start_codon:yes stop_codon:yes gene_type:complete